MCKKCLTWICTPRSSQFQYKSLKSEYISDFCRKTLRKQPQNDFKNRTHQLKYVVQCKLNRNLVWPAQISNLQEWAPMLLCKICCMRGPKAPKRCGGRPRASKRACNRPTSLSSLSESAFGPEGPPPVCSEACAASWGDGGSSVP